MNWQQVLSLLIVALAALALVWGRFRRRKFRFDHGTACGCGRVSPVTTQPSITFHARKGERPRVVVRMN